VGLFSGLIFVFILITLCTKLTKLPFDRVEARRNAFPTMIHKRSHTAPQFGWHPALKIRKLPNGLFDDERVEKSLYAEQGYYTTRNNDVRIFWKSYRPKRLEDVTYAVFLCHGYGDHCDYQVRQYAMTHAALNKAWAFTLDCPGHGRSDGLWALIGDWAFMIKQIAEVLEKVFVPMVQQLGKPMFCWGESQGGAVAIHLCMYRPNLFKGAVIVCPMCDVADEVKPPPAVVNSLLLVSKFAGSLPVVPSKDHKPLIWKDPKMYDSIVNGPCRNKLNYTGKPRLATARELLRGSTEIIRRSETEMITPFLLIHGDSDYVCPIEKSREFYKKAAVDDKTFKTIAGAWHGVILEDPERIFGLVFNWINKRIN